jgi:hypothetical protein
MSKELIEQLAKKIQALPRYSFLLNESGGVKRWANASGDWIDRYEVVTMIDNAIEAYQAAAPIDNVAEALEASEIAIANALSRAEIGKIIPEREHPQMREALSKVRALIPDTQASPIAVDADAERK